MGHNKVEYETIKLIDNEFDYDVKVGVERDFLAKVFAVPGEKGEKGDPGEVPIDTELSPTSENPLENKAIYAALSALAEELELEMPKILYDTKANWDSQVSLVSVQNTMYIYTDYQQEGGVNVPGVKIGDGNAYLIDIPFMDIKYYNHINDETIHITDEEREFWNNKVRCYKSLEEEENLIFTTN